MCVIPTISRLNLGRLIRRPLAALLSLVLLLPNFACRCADGTEIPFCVPGGCGRCQAPRSSPAPHACCAKQIKRSCCSQAKTHGPDYGCRLTGEGRCCQLVIHSQSECPAPQKVRLQSHGLLAYCSALEPLPGVIAAVVNPLGSSLDPGQRPPPLDLVIAHLRLTL